jgi:hypothetical protein
MTSLGAGMGACLGHVLIKKSGSSEGPLSGAKRTTLVHSEPFRF